MGGAALIAPADQLRHAAWRFAPSFMANRARRYERRLRDRLGVPDHLRAYVAEHGDVVASGPCEGMRYPLALALRADAPVAKLRGTYELEIAPHIERALAHAAARNDRAFVDLGTADGYFAVGAARRHPGLRVIGFDLARSARRSTAALARVNGAHLELRGAATESTLLELAPMTGAVLCDIEGAEIDVLTSAVATALRHAQLIVEVHDGLRPGATSALCDRFAKTHRATLVNVAPRVPSGPGDDEMRAIELCWLVMTPLSA